jgi:hypothetical protein
MTCFTGTWNGTTLSTYVNGSLLGSTTPGGVAVSRGLGYNIGSDYSGTTMTQGYLGEIRMYTQALTYAEVLADYNYVVGVRPYA